ncbi:MAG TPA: V-type ATP synthase subunit I [Anaerohalosphaeraceae bacterium]|nr:V-type ATP synthase subunit I [Anaerohalosphaeraceae bacterium]
MAIAPMEKILIIAHRSQAAQLLEALQEAGLVHLLDAAQAMVSKEWPELQTEFRRPKDLEELVSRLEKAIAFLEAHAQEPSGRSLFSPRVEIDASAFSAILSGQEAMDLLDRTEQTQKRLEGLQAELEQTTEQLQRLLPWRNLTCRLEDLASFSSVQVFVGMIPAQNVPAVQQALEDLLCTVELVGEAENRKACLIFAPAAQTAEVQKILRGAEFEAVHLEGLKGTPADLIEQCRRRLQGIDEQIAQVSREAASLSGRQLELKVLYDYYRNLLERKTALAGAPATEQTLFLEGWTKRKDYPRVQEIVRRFEACDVTVLIPTEGEEPPVEIENVPVVRPFETITRLYGMPAPTSVDPTVFLAPFFAVFFGLCMADAGYGLILTALLAWVLRKVRANKGIFWMLLICSITTTLAGLIMGSWFGDAVTSLLPEGSALRSGLDAVRTQLMLFDPMANPMFFFILSLALGYFQIQCGLFIAFFANLLKKDWAAALCDQLVWIVHLNSLLCIGLVSADKLPKEFKTPCIILVCLTSAVIVLFTVRSGGWAGRLGLGVYQLFSTVFFIGDILSYARLLALCLVGAGCGMAINILVKLVLGVPYVGWLLGAVLFVGGHLFNIALSVLGAFVHSLRLQFVEFFPKFFTGGGKDFVPLQKKFQYVEIRK